MSRLTMAPATPLRSLDEVRTVEEAIREETAKQYAVAACRMRETGSTAAAEALERLTAETGGAGFSARPGSPPGRDETPRASDLRRTLPDLFRDEEGEMTASRLATPYRALAAAVRDAERVFAFWTYLAAYALGPEVREAAETLAGDELDRIARLRRERRRAYRAERTPANGAALPLAAALTAASLERRVADALDRLAADLSPADAVRARKFAREAKSMEIEVSRLDAAPGFAESDGTDAPLPVTAERLVERYLEAADVARDEAVVERAQSLARRAIARLAWLGTVGLLGSRPP